MNKILHISYPYITEDQASARLNVDVTGENEKHTLWYETSAEFMDYFTDDRIDPFVVNLLMYAMEHQYDIESDAPISEKLHYQLSEYLMPCIVEQVGGYHPIKLNMPIFFLGGGKNYHPTAVGTGLSGGVDSFYALHRHLNRKESNFNLTHLIFCNAGTNGDYGGEEARTLYKKRKELLENIASENNLTLLCVDTNINEFLNQVQERTCTFRTLSTPLAFQKLFRVYYYGSTYSFHDFHFAYSDPSSYDLLNMQSLSTESLTFYSSGGQTTRLGKLKDLADYKLAQDYLNVCVRTLHNCGECLKCKRTLLDLYALGEIDKSQRYLM